MALARFLSTARTSTHLAPAPYVLSERRPTAYEPLQALLLQFLQNKETQQFKVQLLAEQEALQTLQTI